MARLLILLVAGAVLLAGVVWIGSWAGPSFHASVPQSPVPPSTAPPKSLPLAPDASPLESPSDRLTGDLKEAGWNQVAANKVADLLADWFVVFRREKPAQAQNQMVRLKRLGAYPAVMPLLESHPEVAGLLAGAAHPETIARSLTDAGDDYGWVAGLYARHAAPEDVDRLAEALNRHRTLIGRLLRLGLFGAELPFVFARGDPPAEEYDRWLTEQWQALLDVGHEEDERRIAFQVFLLDQGEELRERLQNNPGFRDKFRTELWPKLERVVGANGQWLLYTNEPHLWDLLALPEGEPLLKAQGRLPIALLFEKGAYPAPLHPFIIGTLRNNERLLLQALVKFRGEPLFTRLLERKLPARTLDAAVARLLRAGTNYPEALQKFNRLSAAALIEDLGPPPDGLQTWVPLYDVYYLGKKKYQGRDLTTADLAAAVIDAASLLPILKGPGTVAKKGSMEALQHTLRQGGKEYAEKQFAQMATKQGARISTKEAALLARRLLDNGTEHELVHYSVAALLHQLQQPLRQAVVKASTVEITNPTRLLFRYSGVSRESFRRMTGLEARLFMRSDARVYVHLGKTPLGNAAAHFVNHLNDEIADRTAAVVTAEEHQRAWQKNAAIWWLINAAGLDERTQPGETNQD